MSDTTIDKNERTATALIELGCVMETASGFEVRMPVMRNQNPVVFRVEANLNGEMVCDCFTFLERKTCAHRIAAQRLAAATRPPVLPYTATLEWGNRKGLDGAKTKKCATKAEAIDWLKKEAADKFQPEGAVWGTFGETIFEITDEYFLNFYEAA